MNRFMGRSPEQGSGLEFFRALSALMLMFLTGCGLTSEVWTLKTGSPPEIYTLLDRVATQYAQEPFSKETVLCKANFLLAIKASDVRLLRVEADFAQIGHKHNEMSDGSDGNLRNVRRNIVVFDIPKQKVFISKGLPWDIDVIIGDFLDDRPLQGCEIYRDVYKRPWANYDPYVVLEKAESMGGDAFRKEFCGHQQCWAQVYSDGSVRIGRALENANTEVTWSSTESKDFQTGMYMGR